MTNEEFTIEFNRQKFRFLELLQEAEPEARSASSGTKIKRSDVRAFAKTIWACGSEAELSTHIRRQIAVAKEFLRYADGSGGVTCPEGAEREFAAMAKERPLGVLSSSMINAPSLMDADDLD